MCRVRPYRRGCHGASCLDVRDHRIDSLGLATVCKDQRPIAAPSTRVTFHDTQIGADIWREVNLVDHEQVGEDQACSALAWDLVAVGDVDHIEIPIDQFRAEGQREVVSTTLDEGVIGEGMCRLELFEDCQIHRWVLTDSGVRAGSGLDPRDPALLDDAVQRGPHMHLVLATEDVVGDHEALAAGCNQARHEQFDQGRLARTHRSADADPEWPIHDANILAPARSWRAIAMSSWKALLRISLQGTCDAIATASTIAG